MRMALKSLKIRGVGGAGDNENEPEEYMPSYEFTYYGTSCSQSCSIQENNQDDFGFYNDQNSPSGTARDSNVEDAKSWSIETITYPTGGIDTLLYENDKVLNTEKPLYAHFDFTNNNPEVDHNIQYDFSFHGLSQGGSRVTKIIRSTRCRAGIKKQPIAIQMGA